MKVVKVTIPKGPEFIEIFTFADLHIGDKFSDLTETKSTIEYISVTPHAFAILNGDIMNNATKTSVSDSYAEQLTPMEQLDTFVTIFKPIKDKILAITSGNHENRTYNKEGVDLTAVAAQQLGILDRYGKTGVVLFLKVGEHRLANNKLVPIVYSFYINHGSGGGRKEGAKAIRLADMASIVDVDIYIHSHTHLPFIMKQGFFRTDMSNGCVKYTDKLFVNTSAQLKYGGYGEAFEFKPSSRHTPHITLSATTKSFIATL